MVLSASKRSILEGIQGELGWVLDAQRGDKRLLGIVSQLAAAPGNSLPNKFLRALFEHAGTAPSDQVPPIIVHALQLVKCYSLDIKSLGTNTWKADVSKRVTEHAERVWIEGLQHTSRLKYAYGPAPTLAIRDYATLPSFRGRRLFMQLRIDDLPLRAASYNTYEPQNCQLCYSQALETREHYVLLCTAPALVEVRNMYSFQLPLLDLRTPVTIHARMCDLLFAPPNPTGGAQPERISRIHLIGNFLADLFAARGESDRITATLNSLPRI